MGVKPCSFELPFIQARLDQQGKLDAKIGAVGLPAIVESNMRLWLRCHVVPLGAAFESVSVTAMRRGKGAPWKDTMVIDRGARESFTLIQRLGYRIYPAGKAFLHASPTWLLVGLLWFMSRILHSASYSPLEQMNAAH